MWIWLWFLCLCWLLFKQKQKEPLTIKIDTDVLHKYAILPAYRGLLSWVPFKYEYRKARQYFKSS